MGARRLSRARAAVVAATRSVAWGRGLVAVAALGAAISVPAAVGTAGGSPPRCLGAESRDPIHRCENTKLKFMVVPTPSEALLVPDAPCTPIEAIISVCAFGVPAAGAAGTMALVGDSHAEHWRAALEVLGRALRWSGLSITRSSCTFTRGVSAAPEPKRAQCITWNRGVVQWFAEHPEVSTVFTSDHPGPVKTVPGQSEIAAWVAGITSAWAALPATVKHIIVIRDDPFITEDTLPCVERAIAKREDAGLACAVPRRRALHIDPDVVAAEGLHSPRVQIVDLTHFFCDSRLCYPVIGGVLVYRDDFDHLTRAFSTSLGPFLLRDVRALMKTWHQA